MTTNSETTMTFKVHFRTEERGRKILTEGAAPPPPPAAPALEGSIPRVTKLMALAIRLEGLLRDGHLRDYADIARLGGVTRARVTQIMNLLNLAPDIQEAILALPRTTSGRDPIGERDLRRVVAEVDWERQRQLWRCTHS